MERRKGAIMSRQKRMRRGCVLDPRYFWWRRQKVGELPLQTFPNFLSKVEDRTICKKKGFGEKKKRKEKRMGKV